ncbi:MAG TPA: hypothetical protein PLV92_15400, partial [Pirellulaceae bacterium]|nr:hypothetical protein [Pirellulaceae bacterium]
MLNTKPIINGTGAADTLTMTATAGFGVRFWLNSNPAVTLAGPVVDFTFNGRGEDDLFTVQLNSFALPAVAISTIGSTGNDGIDRVTFASVATGHGNGSVSIDTGANGDTVSFSPLAGPLAMSLQGRGGIDGFTVGVALGGTPYSITNVDNLIGSSAIGSSPSSGDTVTLDLDVPAVWNITDAGVGNVQVSAPNRVLTFSGIENLVGASSSQDRFVFGSGTPSLAGRIDGRGAPNGSDVSLGDLLDYSAYSVAITANLTTGVAPGVGGGLATDANGSSIEQLVGSAFNDVLIGDSDRNGLVGRGGDDTLRGMGADDSMDGEVGNDTLQVSDSEAEYDVLQGGAGQDQVVNVGLAAVTMNRFNTEFDAAENGIEQYLGGGYGLKGNLNGNRLHFGFTSILNTPSISGVEANDDITTSWTNSNATPIAYDGGAGGADHATIVLTPDQLAAFTTTDLPALQGYLKAPTGKTLTILATPSKGNLTLTNFELVDLAVADDGEVIKITPYFLALAGRPQLIVGGKTTSDSLTGTPLTDLIFGQGGNDWIDAGDGGDAVFGGAGDDLLQGNLGA